jgi:hypothetical protein
MEETIHLRRERLRPSRVADSRSMGSAFFMDCRHGWVASVEKSAAAVKCPANSPRLGRERTNVPYVTNTAVPVLGRHEHPTAGPQSGLACLGLFRTLSSKESARTVDQTESSRRRTDSKAGSDIPLQGVNLFSGRVFTPTWDNSAKTRRRAGQELQDLHLTGETGCSHDGVSHLAQGA